jgi:hypothetical protein
MDGPFDKATVAGLAEALRLDPTLAGEPERLRRALADLAPQDERGGWLLALGAAAGVPALLGRDLIAEAHARLCDLAACRADAAAWTVEAWARALGHEAAGGEFAGDEQVGAGAAGGWPEAMLADLDPDAGGAAPGPAEQPGIPTALRIALWPDGEPVLAAVTMQGVFVVGSVQAYGRWRRVADVRAPLSRDVALALETVPGGVLWTDHDGVRVRALRRHGARLVLGEPRVLAAAPDGVQARYPVAALAQPGGDLSVLWTPDRLNLTLTEDRAWGTGTQPGPVPNACGDGERLNGLHWCLETEQTGWLLCTTDRGRLLAARWDVPLNEAGQWIDLEPPAVPVAAALACVGEVVFAVATTPRGDLLSLDIRGALGGYADWHSLDRPAQVSAAPPPRVLAAGARRDRPGLPGWLALAGPGGVWAVPVTRSGDILVCGNPANVWTGE